MFYRYTPLRDPKSDTRLLHLLPGQFDDPIEIELHHECVPDAPIARPARRLTLKELRNTLPQGQWVKETREGRFVFYGAKGGTSWEHPDPDFPRELYDPPDPLTDQGAGTAFEALSYTWGDASQPTAELAVSDHFHGSELATLVVRQSLYEALQHLRFLHQPRILWVDAICINQEDIGERNKQIRRMKSIYGLAQGVIIWLGPGSKDSDLACSALSFLGAQVIQTTDATVLSHPDATEFTFFESGFALPVDESTHEAIESLICRPWFERLWVWQEAVLAYSHAYIQCGKSRVPWPLFCAAIRRLIDSRVPFSFRKWQATFVSQLTECRMDHPFYDLTFGTILHLCTDPRDRVYALLGIAPSQYSEAILVDYTRPVAQVYKEAFEAYVNSFNDLALLTHCSPLDRNYDLPSWVPDWSSKSNQPWHPGAQFSSAQSAAQACFIKPDKLLVHGVRCGVVKSVGAVCEAGNASEQSITRILEVIRSWLPEDIQRGNYVTGEAKSYAYIRALTVGNEQVSRNNDIDTSDVYSGFWDIVCSHTEIDPNLGNPYTAELVKLCRNHCFFQCDEGYYGLTNVGVEPGDQLCVLLGLSRPIILRQTPNGDYRVIALSYVHGLERSEGLLGPIPHPWQWEYEWVPDHWTSIQVFRNTITGTLTDDDPRLGVLPEGWSKVRSFDPVHRQMPLFRNDRTGEETKFDPRLVSQELKEKGVPLRSFSLI